MVATDQSSISSSSSDPTVAAGTVGLVGGVANIPVTFKTAAAPSFTVQDGAEGLTGGVGAILVTPGAITLRTAGAQTITAADAADPALTGSATTTATVASGATPPVTPPAPALAGTVSLDRNSNGLPDAGELGLAGRILRLDLDASGIPTPGEPTSTPTSPATSRSGVMPEGRPPSARTSPRPRPGGTS